MARTPVKPRSRPYQPSTDPGIDPGTAQALVRREAAWQSSEAFKKTGENTILGQLTMAVKKRLQQQADERNPPPVLNGADVVGFQKPANDI